MEGIRGFGVFRRTVNKLERLSGNSMGILRTFHRLAWNLGLLAHMGFRGHEILGCGFTLGYHNSMGQGFQLRHDMDQR